MCDKMATSAYILKIVENDPFLRLQMRAKEPAEPASFLNVRDLNPRTILKIFTN